jgi:hypothetical protein
MASAPIEQKVAVGTLTGISGLAVSWVLVTFTPVIDKLPHSLATSVPGAVALIVGFLGAWMAKHTPRLEEIVETLLTHGFVQGTMAQVGGTATGARIMSVVGGGGGEYGPEPAWSARAKSLSQTMGSSLSVPVSQIRPVTVSAADLGTDEAGVQTDPFAGPMFEGPPR